MVLAFCVVVAHAVVVVVMVRWINGRMVLFLDLIDSRSAGRVRRMVSVKVFGALGVIGLSTLTIFALGDVNIYLPMRASRFTVTENDREYRQFGQFKCRETLQASFN